MLPKQKRLSGRDITNLFKGGKTTGTPFFVARYAKEGDKTVRCAVIAPKTIAKTAVMRTSLRRKWYASIDQALTTAAPVPGTYAFVLKKEAIPLNSDERTQAISSFFSKNR